MSSSAVRAAVADYLRPTPGITKMFRDEPWIVTAEAWTTEEGLPGTVAYVHIDREAETRFALTGPPGAFPGIGKAVEYDVSIVVLYQYAIPDDPDDKDSWVDGLDALLDALKDRIRADPNLGAPDVIWQAGEGGTLGGSDLTVQRDLPKLHHGKVLSWNALQFKLIEMAGTSD